MVTQPKQNFSFLGGLVSRALWNRSDIENYGKWFAEATNVRLSDLGPLVNRTGTKRLYDMSETEGPYKMLSFSFNNNETCCIILAKDCFVVFKSDGTPVMDSGEESSSGYESESGESGIEYTGIKKFNSILDVSGIEDVKYCQSGDIIYVVNGIQKPVMIKRLSKDFSNWEMVEFDAEIFPIDIENDEKDKKLSLATITKTIPQGTTYYNSSLSFNLPNNTKAPKGYYSKVKFDIYKSDSQEWINIIDTTQDESIKFSNSQLANALSSSSTLLTYARYVQYNPTNTGNDSIDIVLKDGTLADETDYTHIITKINLTINGDIYKISNVNGGKFVDGATHKTDTSRTHTIVLPENCIVTRMSWSNGRWNNEQQYGVKSHFTYVDMVSPYEALIALGADMSSFSQYFTVDAVNRTISCRAWYFADASITSYHKYYGVAFTGYTAYSLDYNGYNIQKDFNITEHTTGEAPIVISNHYMSSDGFSFFSDKQVGDVFAIRHHINSQNIHMYIRDAFTGYSNVILGSKKWRYISAGAWGGAIELQYSDDGQKTWKTFFKRKTDGDKTTINDNTSGEIDTDEELIAYRVFVSIGDPADDYPFNFDFNATERYVRSYYKITNIIDANSAEVKCIKNDVGDFYDYDNLNNYAAPFSNILVALIIRVNGSLPQVEIKDAPICTSSFMWSESLYSNSKKWPTAANFYQNRLFFGKDWYLNGSSTNDFYDFYEPILKEDDGPVSMSLLGYKVDNIQNILTTRSFFTFTSGGEYGISSEVALTQKDKQLKQLSYHGSNSCVPILCGNTILFVDSSNNTVRAFQYSFEIDGYEAQDVTHYVQDVFKGKTIKTTAYIKKTKECLFLTTDGEIFVFKFIKEQEISSWYMWKHAKYTIDNICVVPKGSEEVLFMLVSDGVNMYLEQLSEDMYADSVISTIIDDTESLQTPYSQGDKVVVNDGVNKYFKYVDENGCINNLKRLGVAKIGLSYQTVATLLTPVMPLDRYGTIQSTFNKRIPFKVYISYLDSYGFKVGVTANEKFSPEFMLVNDVIDNETKLVSGQKCVNIPASFNNSSMISFVQDKPYPMVIDNTLIEVEYGGR